MVLARSPSRCGGRSWWDATARTRWSTTPPDHATATSPTHQRGNDEYQRHGSSLDKFEAWAPSARSLDQPRIASPAIEQLDAGMFSPLIVRAAWPGQTSEQVIDYLDQLGREVISAVDVERTP